MTFSEKLARLRKREGLSQEELASYLGVSRQAVSRWEQGTAMPDAPNLVKLRQRFRVSLDWLLEDGRGWRSWMINSPAERRPPRPLAGAGPSPEGRSPASPCWGCCFWGSSAPCSRQAWRKRRRAWSGCVVTPG